MATGPTELLHAVNRFGLGARPGDAQRLAGDPRGAVLAQIARRDAAVLSTPALPSSDAAYVALRRWEVARDRERLMAAAVPSAPAPLAMSPQSAAVAAKVAPPLTVEQALFRAEAAARFERMATTESPLVERLVMFWANHFAVSVAKGNNLRALAGPFEREAIRPHVLGRFADMLKAVETHPAMLFYLDNTASTGPTSRTGLSSKRGLNENLAREILELHTLGVDGGYSQEDVTSFARIITGWMVTNPDDDAFFGGRFTFGPARHEPGTHTVLGVAYPETSGPEQGFSVLAALARHPSTARNVARKLARHFVADDPPQGLVDRLARCFLDTDGDLQAVTRLLVEAPEAWSAPASKIRPPVELVAASMRASGKVAEPAPVLNLLGGLGQPLWQVPGPNGWSDRMEAWASPEGMDSRLDMAAQWGRQNGQVNPRDLLDSLFGPAVSPQTRQAVMRAESRPQGLALLLMSPEIQRR